MKNKKVSHYNLHDIIWDDYLGGYYFVVKMINKNAILGERISNRLDEGDNQISVLLSEWLEEFTLISRIPK
jgi:hypothetical protein